MKKINYLLFILVLFCFVEVNDVLALTNEERKEIMLEQLSDYTFDFKYVDMTDNYELIKENRKSSLHLNYKSWFLSGLVRNELENVIDLESGDAIDLYCYLEGDEYTEYENGNPVITTKEHDGCGMGIYLDVYSSDSLSFRYELNGDFEVVNGDEKVKEEALSLAEQMIDNVYVADVDMLNHYVNYKSNSSTFFESNNALLEFANLKKIVEENPDYNFFVGYQDTRRGNAYASFAEGSTYVEKDGIIYAFTINTYTSANMFFVPIGTPIDKYGEVLEKRLKEYVNNENINIEILSFDETEDNFLKFPNAEVSYTLENNLNVNIDKYYELVVTDSEKEKIDDDYVSDCEKCVAMYSYQMIINGERYEIGIMEMYDEKLKEFGTILSRDNKTGIILKTFAGNVPLDAKLLVETLELTKEEKDKLNSLGYTGIGAYNFQLYSIILDKVIHNFSDVTDVLIPLEGNVVADKLKVIYLSDHLDKLEYFDTKVVEYEGNKYLQFSTRHFSNYVVVESNEIPPKTGDNIITYIGLFILSISVFGNIFYILKKRLSN